MPLMMTLAIRAEGRASRFLCNASSIPSGATARPGSSFLRVGVIYTLSRHSDIYDGLLTVRKGCDYRDVPVLS